jgi:putative membrane protein
MLDGMNNAITTPVAVLPRRGRRWLPPALLLAFVLLTALSGYAPRHPSDWWLENLVVLPVLGFLIHGYRHLRFSDAAYLGLFVVGALHALGAHYTYSEVPYREALAALGLRDWLPAALFERNHFDRMVHFLYGLLVTPACVELLDARAPQRGLWRWLVPWFFVIAHGTLYEIIEAAAAGVFGGDLGAAFLGTQGDEWDAQKDMALAALGSLLALAWLRRPQSA